jgi:phosphoadenosine phosphosulfate reductase
MTSSNAANGKTFCNWCDRCGTLILGRRCGCGSEPRVFEINSPGDIRPAMGEGLVLVLSLFKGSFGTAAPLERRSVFLNKVPGEDRTDEVIAHGAVIAVLRFDIQKNDFALELKQPGAELFNTCASKNIVTFGSMSGHLKGKVIPGECIRDIVGNFAAGEPVILRKGEKIGHGIALGASTELKEMERAVKIRDLDAPAGVIVSPECNRQKFVESNRQNILNMESQAVSDVKSFISRNKQPVTVSFSGGKDSLAALGVAMKAVKDLELLFVNTGLEFPETVEYVRSFAKEKGLVLHESDAGDAFWRNVDTFGPPAKDFRWCCKLCKLGPVTDMIARNYPKGTVTIEGNRMLESFARSRIGFISKNPFVPNQTTLNPVREWTEADIWGYIWMKGLRYNPLYERDFERIGCYLCASCLTSEWRNTGRIHPELYARWEDHLHDYAKQRGLPKEYVDLSFWRWKVLPPKMVRMAEDMGLDLVPKRNAGPTMSVLKGATSCAAGGYSMEAIVNIPRSRDFGAVEDALRTIGNVRYSSEFEIALLKCRQGTVKVFGGGQISVVTSRQDDAKELFEDSVKALLRAQMCTECGVCAKKCQHRAITIHGGLHVDPERCTSCGECESSCMVAHYYDKIMAGERL